MPLLTELASGAAGFGYKHGAPDGAQPPKPSPHSAENSEGLPSALRDLPKALRDSLKVFRGLPKALRGLPKHFWGSPKALWDVPKPFGGLPKHLWDVPKQFWGLPKHFWETPEAPWESKKLRFCQEIANFAPFAPSGGRSPPETRQKALLAHFLAVNQVHHADNRGDHEDSTHHPPKSSVPPAFSVPP